MIVFRTTSRVALAALCWLVSNALSAQTVVAEAVFADGFEHPNPAAVLQWRAIVTAVPQLFNQQGQLQAGPFTCTSSQPSVLSIAADCTQFSANRLGTYSYTISNGAVTQTLPVRVIPPRHPLSSGTGTSALGSTLGVVLSDGTAAAWGANGYSAEQTFVQQGLLARGSTSASVEGSPAPGFILNSAGSARFRAVCSIEFGTGIAGLVDEEGRAYLWGSGDLIAFPDQDPGPKYLPIPVLSSQGGPALTRVVQLALGEYNKIALLDDGQVLSFGRYLGQGQGDIGLRYPAPVRVMGGSALSNVVQIGAGLQSSYALLADGRVFAWGQGQACELGNSTSTAGCADSDLAQPVLQSNGSSLTNIVSIAAGAYGAYALSLSGQVYAWGANHGGSAGGSNVFDYVPAATLVQSSSGPLSNVVAIAGGGNNGFALTNTGEVWAFGDVSVMAQGSTDFCTCSSGAAQAYRLRNPNNSGLLSGVQALGSSYETGLAMLSDGRVLSWGIAGATGTALGQGIATSDAPGLLPQFVKSGLAGSADLQLGALRHFQNLHRRYR